MPYSSFKSRTCPPRCRQLHQPRHRQAPGHERTDDVRAAPRTRTIGALRRVAKPWRPTAPISTRRQNRAKIDILVGRDLEIERTIQILHAGASKNNPLFVGDPGWARPRSPRSGPAHRPRRSAGGPAQRGDLPARHGRAARRHLLPRRFRRAPEGRAHRARGRRSRGPVHRRDPHRDRRRRDQRRLA